MTFASATFVNTVASGDDSAPEIKTLQHLPCANHDVQKQWVCPKAGASPCSGCHLVSYCSRVSHTCRAVYVSSRLTCRDRGRLVRSNIGLLTKEVSFS